MELAPFYLTFCFDVKPDIQRWRRVRDRPDRDAIDAGERNGPDRFERHSAGRFQLDFAALR
jgi:hypothetical protein